MQSAFSLLLTQFALLLGVVLGITLVVYILLQRHSPQVTVAWLLTIVFLPYIGIPLYLLFGGRKMRRTTALKSLIDFKGVELPTSEGTGSVRDLLQAYGLPNPCAGNELELLESGEETYCRLIELIDEAKTSINIAIFIFSKDEVAREIRDHLAEKAVQGVSVRVLLDGVGSLHTHRRFFQSLLQAGGRVSYFMPLLHRPFRGRTNLRNHRKIVLIDDTSVWTGGRNIGIDYMGPTPDPNRWRDLSFVLKGPATKTYSEVFRADWEFASGESIMPPLDTPFQPFTDVTHAIAQIIPSGPDLPHDGLYDAIITAAFTARERLWIVSPYFVPDHALAQALEITAKRGVDVRIIVPQESNFKLADMVRGCYLRELQRAGASIFLYRLGMLHAKLLIKDDDLAMLGSANMDVRSLFLDYEIAALFYDRQSIIKIEAWTEDTLRDCQRGVREASMIHRLFEGVLHIVAPVV